MESEGMKLTPFAKLFFTVVILGVLGYVGWHYKGDQLRKWATGQDKAAPTTSAEVSSSDFDNLKNAPADPGRDAGSEGVTPVTLAGGKLDRPLVVAINTWAGHAPGIVFNNGLDSNANSGYRTKYGLDVKFVLIEDPAAKLAAFRKGDVDIMWNTVDNWAREASVLVENNQRAKSIIMQDWSRGGDGIVSLSSIKSIEDLKGRKIACTQFTPSHFLLLYLMSQSGLSSEDRAAVVETRTCASSPRAVTAPDRSGSQVTAASTWRALNIAAAAGASWVKMMFFSTAARSSELNPDCDSR